MTKIFSNFGYKVAAILLAGLVWYVVQGEEVLEVNARLDIKIELSSSLAMRDATPITRDITLRGSRVLVGNMSGRTFQAIIRVPSGKVGNLRYRLDKEYIPRWDNRVRLTIHDPYVTFYVEERLTRTVPVKPTVLGNLNSSLTLEEVTSTPAEIEISGVKSDVQKMKDLPTEPIDLTDFKESKTVTSSIARAGIPDFNFSQTNVRLNFKIAPKKTQKTISLIPVEILDSDKVSSARPNSISVTVLAIEEQASKLNPRDFHATVSAKDLGPGRYERSIDLRTPEGVSVIQTTPNKVFIEVYNQKKLR